MASFKFNFIPKQFAPKPKQKGWLMMRIDDEYILSWAMTAPNGLQSAIASGQVVDEELVQANAIIECLQNINPPRLDHLFLIQLGDNYSFVDFRIVPNQMKATRPGEYLSETLSLFPRDWYQGGYDRLVNRFHQEFFGHTPTIREMEAFIMDPKSCNIGYQEALFTSESRGPQANC